LPVQRQGRAALEQRDRGWVSSFSATQPKGRKGEQTHHQKFDVERDPGKAKGTTKQMRAKDRPLANDFVSDEAFDRLLDAWFGNIARVLMPGAGSTSGAATRTAATTRRCLKKHGLYFSPGHRVGQAAPGPDAQGLHGRVRVAFYGWRRARRTATSGRTTRPDLWHVKKVNPQSMVHLTEKPVEPVELAVRAMQYSSRPGENVPRPVWRKR
jgi:hypothetical protein